MHYMASFSQYEGSKAIILSHYKISFNCPPYYFKISHICSFIYIKSLDMGWQLLSGKMIITFYNANRELECTGNMNNFFCDWTRICINKNFQFLHQSFYKVRVCK